MINEKDQLIQKSEDNFRILFEIIESIPSKKRTISMETETRDKNFRDILMHLYEWHAMFERWYREGMDDCLPSIPAPGYKWSSMNQLNHQIWKNYQDVTLNEAVTKLKSSHRRVMDLIKSHSNEEIITKKYYKWTKSRNLYNYFDANTSDHYLWAIEKCEVIRDYINTLDK